MLPFYLGPIKPNNLEQGGAMFLKLTKPDGKSIALRLEEISEFEQETSADGKAITKITMSDKEVREVTETLDQIVRVCNRR